MSRLSSLVLAVIAMCLLLALGFVAARWIEAHAVAQAQSRLYGLLRSNDPREREHALWRLAAPEHGSADIQVAVRLLSTDPSVSVRIAAASAIERWIRRQGSEHPEEARVVYRHLLQAMTEDDSSDVRAWASLMSLYVLEAATCKGASGVSNSLGVIAAPYLKAALGDTDSDVRENAREAIRLLSAR